MTPRILAIDPGQKTGWAILEFGGNCVDKGIVLLDDLPEFLSTLPGPGFSCVVIEDFRLYRRLASQQSGSTIPAATAIGMVTGFSKMANYRIVKQPPGARKLGAQYIQFALGKSHTPDDISAWLHGIYYLKQIGQLTTALERRLQNEQK